MLLEIIFYACLLCLWVWKRCFFFLCFKAGFVYAILTEFVKSIISRRFSEVRMFIKALRVS